ncbi:hemicentin-2-like isoform X2 [Macrobrachium nipponense]
MDEGSSTRASDVFEGRARFQKDHLNWVLVVKDVTYSDQGEYRCRLDFQGSPTHNAKVHLHVVDEPHSIRIYSTGGSAIEREASVQEGRPLSLSCRATGGEPLPNVTWWSGPTLLDSEEEERQVMTSSSPSTVTPNTQAAPYVTNTLHIDSLTKAHLAQNLTCVAANTPVLRPLTSTVLLRQTETELLVSMDAPTGRLLGDHEYDVKCRASGVRPPPIVTWWLRGNRLMENIDGQSVGPDATISLLRLLTTPGDDGGILECRASSPTLPHLTASDSTKLTVYYLPKATISIDAGGGQGSPSEFGQPATSASGLREGRSATLTCVTRANPPIYNLTFMFNGRPLHRQNVITKGWSLTLLELRHQDSGLYTCLASNTEGDGESNAVALHIDYAPVCAWKGEREILAAVGEKVKMNCYVKASPPRVTFDWTTSHKESPIHHQDKGLSSEGWMTASNSSRIGVNQWAKCYATNDVGSSSHPCVFSITLVEPPSQLVGCDYHEVTTDSAAVTCSAGSTSEKLTPTYHIEVREGNTVILTKNSSKPRFNLSTLSPGRDYVLAMYASHQKGRGKETTLLLRTPTPKAEEVAPERVSINLNNEPGAEILLQQPPLWGLRRKPLFFGGPTGQRHRRRGSRGGHRPSRRGGGCRLLPCPQGPGWLHVPRGWEDLPAAVRPPRVARLAPGAAPRGHVPAVHSPPFQRASDNVLPWACCGDAGDLRKIVDKVLPAPSTFLDPQRPGRDVAEKAQAENSVCAWRTGPRRGSGVRQHHNSKGGDRVSLEIPGVDTNEPEGRHFGSSSVAHAISAVRSPAAAAGEHSERNVVPDSSADRLSTPPHIISPPLAADVRLFAHAGRRAPSAAGHRPGPLGSTPRRVSDKHGVLHHPTHQHCPADVGSLEHVRHSSSSLQYGTPDLHGSSSSRCGGRRSSSVSSSSGHHHFSGSHDDDDAASKHAADSY